MPVYFGGEQVGVLDQLKIGGKYDVKSIQKEDGTQKYQITTLEQGGIIPKGTLKIEEDGIYDVSEYAEVDVGIEEYQPNADMIWAKSVCEADEEDREYSSDFKHLIMFYDDVSSCSLTVYHGGATKTSDGEYYTNDTSEDFSVEHVWDDTNARDSNVYPGKKVRWAILYRSKQLSSWAYPGTGGIGASSGVYVCANNINYYDDITIGGTFLEYIDFINGCFTKKTRSVKFSSAESLRGFGGLELTPNVTSLKEFLRQSTKLKTFPLIDTSNVTNMQYAFYNCPNLERIPLLDTSNVTNMEQAFLSCRSLIEVPLLNTGKVTAMNSLFSYCQQLRKVPQLDTRSATTMSYMFRECYSLETIPLLNTSSVTAMSAMFEKCESLDEIPSLDTSNVTNMSSMFMGCDSLKKVPLLDTSKVTTMSNMFENCGKLITIPQFNTGEVTSMYRMFYGCASLRKIPLIDTSRVKNMSYMFSSCSSLRELPLLNTSSVTDMSYMFYSNASVSLVLPLFDTSNVTTMSHMFDHAHIRTIPQFNTSNVTNMESMFYNASKLEEIPALNTSNVTKMSSMFYYNGTNKTLKTIGGLDMLSCTSCSSFLNGRQALENLTLKNIKITLQIGSGTSWGHLLTIDSLLNTIKELWNMTSSSTKTLTIGSANTAKLADVYVKLISITDEMRAEDPYIDNKLPFEVCESTDEGAMLITEYVTSKNWQLA